MQPWSVLNNNIPLAPIQPEAFVAAAAHARVQTLLESRHALQAPLASPITSQKQAVLLQHRRRTALIWLHKHCVTPPDLHTVNMDS